MEGTSSCGAGLARHLAAENVAVVEVLRPKRRAGRGHKSDPADAEAAARAVLSGEATACPKSADGPVEAIRMLRAARRSAVEARTAANALWRIATVRLRCDDRAQAYAARRRAEGKTNREILRCLKRHIAREVHRLLTDPPAVPTGADLRRQRASHGLTLHTAAAAIGATANQLSALERGLRHDRPLAERYQQHLTEIAA